MKINDIAHKHWAWIEKVGWHNKSELEYLALIASEVGELIQACRLIQSQAKRADEVADILLRVMDFAVMQGIDIEAALKTKMKLNAERGTRGRLK